MPHTPLEARASGARVPPHLHYPCYGTVAKQDLLIKLKTATQQSGKDMATQCKRLVKNIYPMETISRAACFVINEYFKHFFGYCLVQIRK